MHWSLKYFTLPKQLQLLLSNKIGLSVRMLSASCEYILWGKFGHKSKMLGQVKWERYFFGRVTCWFAMSSFNDLPFGAYIVNTRTYSSRNEISDVDSVDIHFVWLPTKSFIYSHRTHNFPLKMSSLEDFALLERAIQLQDIWIWRILLRIDRFWKFKLLELEAYKVLNGWCEQVNTHHILMAK